MGNWASGLRLALVGNNERSGVLLVLLIYFVLLNIVFLYLYPIFYMLATMLKNTTDLLDPTVRWIPRTFHWDNLKLAWEGLNYLDALGNSLLIAGTGSLFHIVSCSLTGYAFARFRFPGRNVLLGVLIISFLIPPQTVLIPFYVMFSKLGLTGTMFGVTLPALFAQGVRGALFVIIFRQFFMTLPKELDEAAKIDGAGALHIFARVMLPLAKPAIVVVFLFSFVWHWNETFVSGLMLGRDGLPLSLSLSGLHRVLSGIYGEGDSANETVKMAASFLIIVPPLLLYAVAQKWFVQGIEKSGLVE